MNDLVTRICEAAGRTPEEIAAAIDSKDDWGKLVHSFEYLTALGVVRDEITKDAPSASEQLERIKNMHRKSEGEGGMTSGYCCECDYLWPCPTYHVAAGWGLDSFHDCAEARWCSHAEIVMR